MQKYKSGTPNPKNWFSGAFYICAAVICIVLGLVGLIVPVLPGIIFLALAAVFLARISATVDRWVKRSPFMSTTQLRMDSMAELGWSDRIRLTFWYIGYGMVKVGEFSARQINKIKNRR